MSDILEGGVGTREIARQHSLSRNLIRRCIEKYAAGQLTEELADAGRIAEYEVKIAALERRVGQLTMEIDLLKKKRTPGTAVERRELLRRERPAAISVAAGCRIMKLTRSTYYYFSRRSAAKQKAMHHRLLNSVRNTDSSKRP